MFSYRTYEVHGIHATEFLSMFKPSNADAPVYCHYRVVQLYHHLCHGGFIALSLSVCLFVCLLVCLFVGWLFVYYFCQQDYTEIVNGFL